ISSDVAELKDMVRALLLDKKNQSSALATSPTPAPVKAVESNRVTCGADFVVVDFEPDPRVPLILERCFLKTGRDLIDVRKAKMIKSSVDEPPDVELKDLPPHLEYAFLEGDNKLPVIIAKELGEKEKADLIKVLKSHKRAIAWKLSDIQGINPEFCTHKILMEKDYKPVVQHQRRVNPKIHDVIKKEMVSAGIFKFPSTLVIKKKQRLTALMECSLTVACLSVCAMRWEHFKDAC
nr:reverse transcriptase domain-containing protein [Tanacetum cinerariifolium]